MKYQNTISGNKSYKYKHRHNLKNAFSLVEISIVILVIGILIIGISNGIELYQDTKLSTARSLTLNSRVGRINGLVLWLETTLENNFSSGTTNFNNIKNITQNTSINRWRDINPLSISPNNATQTSSSNQPKIIIDKDSMLPMVNFTNTSSQYLNLPNGTIPFGNSEYTVILVSKPNSIPATGLIGNIILSAGSWGGKTINFFTYGSGGRIINVWVGSDINLTPILLKRNAITVITYDLTQRKGYINGEYKSNFTDGNLNTSNNHNYIGIRQGSTHYLDGDIGEIIIYDRALTDKERQDIEQYLAKKWNIEI